jgi:uncharacterized protein (UPF0548 family)
MFLLRKPSSSFIRAFLEGQAKLPFTYPSIGATAEKPPPGYVVDHTRIRIGTGEAAFVAAKDALRRWDHFRLGWVEPFWPDTPIEPGQVVGILGSCCGMKSLNACRIVYVRDEPKKFGFAYGTLPGHIESGEERFTVGWREDDSVWYDILAFSRLNHILARLGYPLIRRLQKRFARDSAAAMRKAVGL